MEENNDFMSLFNSDNFELNMDVNPEEIFDNTEDTDEDEQNDDSLDLDNDNLDEGDDSSEEVDEDEASEEEGGDEDETSPNIYSSFASVLSEQGLLPSLELQNKKVETVDDLTDIFKVEIDNQVKNYLISKIGEDGYDALEKGISLSQYQSHKEAVQTLDNIDETVLSTDLELSKRIILQDYINQGMDESRAMRILKKSIDLGEDSIVEDAKESLISLKAFEEKRIEQEKINNEIRIANEIKAQEKIDNDLKNTIYNAKEFIKGIPVNKTIQDKVYQSITKVVSQSPNGIAENKLMKDRRENPIEFDTKLYYLYEVTNGFKDFSKIMSKTESKVLSDFERSLRQNKHEEGNAPAFMKDPESYGGLGSEIVF